MREVFGLNDGGIDLGGARERGVEGLGGVELPEGALTSRIVDVEPDGGAHRPLEPGKVELSSSGGIGHEVEGVPKACGGAL